MSQPKVGVTLLAQAPCSLPENAIEVDGGTALPVAFGGLRRILLALSAERPALRERFIASHPGEWNRLFPGEVGDAPDLSDLALSPSERRLHRESEQTFWILNAAAAFIVEALRELGRPLVVRNAGLADLVSLRGLMRAAEWARLEEVPARIVLGEVGLRRRHCAAGFSTRREELLQTLLGRMGASPAYPGHRKVVDRAPEPTVDLEGRYLALAVDDQTPVEARLAASVLAVRSCFFTTNYEGAMLAVEQALALLDARSDRIDEGQLASAWDELDSGLTSPAIEIDRSSLGSAQELRALFHRSSGVVQAYVGRYDEALADFARALECQISPARQGQMRMFRALTLIKRLGNVEKARTEINAGLAALGSAAGSERLLHEGWLRNVMALTYFQDKQLEAAVAEEKLAIKCVGELHDPSATHLKINLISNLSVVQETAGRFEESIGTWRRFEKISENWGHNFHKHHRYRLAGLTLFAGREAEALGWYASAYASAEKLNDSFHRQVIAVELGKAYLDAGRKEEALGWFERASAHARTFGCPLRLGEALCGQALAQGSSDLQQAARVLRAGSSHPAQSAVLLGAIDAGDLPRLQAVLPRPRSKLNRPFDLVNLG